MATAPHLTDPMAANPPKTSLARWLCPKLVNDARDWPFVRLLAGLSVLMGGSAALQYLLQPYAWLAGAAHLALYLLFVGPFILMLHNTSHRRLFRHRVDLLNRYIPWVLGPLFGETPEAYKVHHVAMHHVEGNMPEDISSTMAYDRASLAHFARYLWRFFAKAHYELSKYLLERRKGRLVVRLLAGEAMMIATMIGLSLLNWRATLVVLVIPYVATRLLMMAGNWGQHAFVDPAEPHSSYKNSITYINVAYNQRCFNDGYHIGHHVKQNRHWTEMPEDFSRNRERYAREGAIVFAGIDFFTIWGALMLHRWDYLARHVVALDGQPKSHEEVRALLQARTRPIVPVEEATIAAA